MISYCILISHLFLLFLQAIRNNQQKSSKKFFLKYKRDYIVLQYNTFNWFKIHYAVKITPLSLFFLKKKHDSVISLQKTRILSIHVVIWFQGLQWKFCFHLRDTCEYMKSASNYIKQSLSFEDKNWFND